MTTAHKANSGEDRTLPVVILNEQNTGLLDQYGSRILRAMVKRKTNKSGGHGNDLDRSKFACSQTLAEMG